jgi:hypothetical protein
MYPRRFALLLVFGAVLTFGVFQCGMSFMVRRQWESRCKVRLYALFVAWQQEGSPRPCVVTRYIPSIDPRLMTVNDTNSYIADGRTVRAIARSQVVGGKTVFVVTEDGIMLQLAGGGCKAKILRKINPSASHN